MATKNKSALKVTTPSDREISLTREFNAPRSLVFKAMTDPALIPKWWGPRNSTTRVDKMDVRPGGVWRFLNTGSDGVEYAFNGVFKEIVPTERIVQTFEFEPMAGHISTDTLILTEKGGKTLLSATSVFQTVEDRDQMIQSGMEEGAGETYDRLEELLRTLA